MTAIVVSGATPLGGISNQIAADAQKLNNEVVRLEAAIAQASSGYGGTAGTQFETGTNFGVAPTGTPGQAGADWRFAMDSFAANWATFWAANKAYIAALDQGTPIG